MAKIEGVDRLMRKLKARELSSKEGDDVSVIFGYTANYAIYVHENLEAAHTNGQSKFLEQPFRELQDEFRRMIVESKKKGHSLEEALVLCALKLQRESMQLVPVASGNLRGSAFTPRVIRGGKVVSE